MFAACAIAFVKGPRAIVSRTRRPPAIVRPGPLECLHRLLRSLHRSLRLLLCASIGPHRLLRRLHRLHPLPQGCKTNLKQNGYGKSSEHFKLSPVLDPVSASQRRAESKINNFVHFYKPKAPQQQQQINYKFDHSPKPGRRACTSKTT